MPGYLIRAEVTSQRRGLVIAGPRAVSKYHVNVSRTVKGSKCWKSPSPSYQLKHSAVRALIYAFLIKSHPCHIADSQGQKLRSHLFLPSQHSPCIRRSQTDTSHSLIFGASCFWYLSVLSQIEIHLLSLNSPERKALLCTHTDKMLVPSECSDYMGGI